MPINQYARAAACIAVQNNAAGRTYGREHPGCNNRKKKYRKERIVRPIVFDGKFGWLHSANGPDGVVMCSPFGYDALCTYRGMRRLAEHLAARGMPVLR